MTFEEELIEWIYYFNRNRQVGHTHAALNGVSNSHNALLVCANENQRKMFPKNSTLGFHSNLQGRTNPVVFDNFTLIMLIEKSLSERIDKQRVREAYLLLESTLGPSFFNIETSSYAKAILEFKNVLGLDK